MTRFAGRCSAKPPKPDSSRYWLHPHPLPPPHPRFPQTTRSVSYNKVRTIKAFNILDSVSQGDIAASSIAALFVSGFALLNPTPQTWPRPSLHDSFPAPTHRQQTAQVDKHQAKGCLHQSSTIRSPSTNLCCLHSLVPEGSPPSHGGRCWGQARINSYPSSPAPAVADVHSHLRVTTFEEQGERHPEQARWLRHP